ncbi:FMN-binding negative transcriptional regulator [Nakamurella lactea]|uniref:FMN-binding negative transcriptional regulator n=1 Tax=Nakamurella lactea TaxID=459515 RepID=UPI0004216D30|nr:FMN-binding negative transcriptional regulator [Nakamurella lactea]
MYLPHFNAISDPAATAEFVRRVAAGTLITPGPDGLVDATLLPILWDGEQRLVAHLARANEQWRRIGDGGQGLVVVQGPDAYVSPAWYASKAEHGRVVPTWNYSAVHLRGAVTVHDDPDWLRQVVTDLTDFHEAGREHPWQVADAPPRYVDGQLRAIVGVELTVTRVEAKAKWSQNRSEADRAGVHAGYLADGDDDAAQRISSGGLD